MMGGDVGNAALQLKGISGMLANISNFLVKMPGIFKFVAAAAASLFAGIALGMKKAE